MDENSIGNDGEGLKHGGKNTPGSITLPLSNQQKRDKSAQACRTNVGLGDGSEHIHIYFAVLLL